MEWANYLKWYYETNVWKTQSYRGVRTLKLPLDMWNYQEIIHEHNLQWVLETGTLHGGSALYFGDLLQAGSRSGIVVSADVSHAVLHPIVTTHPKVRLVLGDSAAPETVARIRGLIPDDRSGGMLLILDSDHSARHVQRELNALLPLLRQGDYLIVEDTIVNGHPVRPDFGPGPLEAVQEYLHQHPGRLTHDLVREAKFGCTFAYRGYYKVSAGPASR
jgi:cephalosporin hydroxylase